MSFAELWVLFRPASLGDRKSRQNHLCVHGDEQLERLLQLDHTTVWYVFGSAKLLRLGGLANRRAVLGARRLIYVCPWHEQEGGVWTGFGASEGAV